MILTRVVSDRERKNGEHAATMGPPGEKAVSLPPYCAGGMQSCAKHRARRDRRRAHFFFFLLFPPPPLALVRSVETSCLAHIKNECIHLLHPIARSAAVKVRRPDRVDCHLHHSSTSYPPSVCPQIARVRNVQTSSHSRHVLLFTIPIGKKKNKNNKQLTRVLFPQ